MFVCWDFAESDFSDKNDYKKYSELWYLPMAKYSPEEVDHYNWYRAPHESILEYWIPESESDESEKEITFDDTPNTYNFPELEPNTFEFFEWLLQDIRFIATVTSEDGVDGSQIAALWDGDVYILSGLKFREWGESCEIWGDWTHRYQSELPPPSEKDAIKYFLYKI